MPKPGPKRGQRRREENSNWRGGRTIHPEGYVLIRIGRRYVLEHRMVMEKHLGRKLRKGEIVHHRNGDKVDNRIANLELTTQSEHVGGHNREIKRKAPIGAAPLCACGCGRNAGESTRKRGTWNRWINGHSDHPRSPRRAIDGAELQG
jgi:hypothetical protein